MNDNILIVDQKQANEKIEAELWRESLYSIYFAFKFDYYDEKMNTILWLSFLKVIDA